MANSWYAYNGVGDPFLPGSYIKITINASCIDGPCVCVIYLLNETDSVPSNPLSNNIITYIGNALATLTRQPNGLGKMAYVYLKNC